MKVRKSDIIWNYAGTFMSIGSNFLLLPFLIYFLSSDVLGLWYVFLSLGGIVLLLDFGFNPTFARNVAYCWTGTTQLKQTAGVFSENEGPNISLLKKLIYTCKKIYLVIALSAMVLLFSIGTIYVLYIAKSLNGYEHIIAWIIYSLAVTLNIYYGYYTTFLRGVGAIKEVNIATVLSRTIQIIISILLLYIGLGIIAVSIAYLCYGVIFRFISKYYFYRYENIGSKLNKDLTTVTKKDIIETFHTVWFNAWRDGVVSLSRYLLSQASVLISSFYLSLSETGIYSISIQLLTALVTISSALYTTYQPSLQAAFIKNDKVLSKHIMSLVMTVYIVLFWFGLVGLILIGLPILNIFNQSLVFDLPVMLGLGVYIFLLHHHSLYASYISNTNKVPYMKSFLLSGILSILLSIILMEETNLGIWSLIIGQLLAQVFYNNWKWPNVVMKDLNTSPRDILKTGFSEITQKIITKKRTEFEHDN